MVFIIQKVKNKQLYRVLNKTTKGIILTTSSKQQAIKVRNVLNKKSKKQVGKKTKTIRQPTKLTGQLQLLNDLLKKSQTGAEHGSFDLPRKQGEFITRIINKEIERQPLDQISPQIPSLTGLKVADLKRLAEERNIIGFKKLNKKELLTVLQPTQISPQPPKIVAQLQQQPQQQSQSASQAFNLATGQTKQEAIDTINDVIEQATEHAKQQSIPLSTKNKPKLRIVKQFTPKTQQQQTITDNIIDIIQAKVAQDATEDATEDEGDTEQDKGVEKGFFSPQIERKQPNLKQLKQTAKERGIKGFSTMKKQELIDALAQTQPQVADATASGIFDSVRGYVSNLLNREQYSPPVKRILERLGGKKIIAMNIIRTPINNNINRALNVISLGKWSQLKNEFHYDNMFHLALILKLDDMSNLLVEKNERINVSTSFKYLPTTQIKHINITGKSILLDDLLNNGNRFVGNTNWFVYSAFKNNCQAFIKATLEGNGLYTADVNNFVYQDMTEIRKQLPRNVVPTANFITDLGSLVSRLRGQGIH